MTEERTINLDISKRLEEDEEFRKGFFRAVSRNEIAAQIVALRKKRKMRQGDLAAAVSTRQSAISRLEKAEYASWNYQTLLGIAEALRARLKIAIEPIEEAIAEYRTREEPIFEESVNTNCSVTTDTASAGSGDGPSVKSQQGVRLSIVQERPIEYSTSIH